MESILTSIKLLLGITEEDTSFDQDLIMQINSVFSILTMLGVGPKSGYSIIDENDIWTDFIPENPRLEMVKSYIHKKVRLMFDPPQSSAHIEALNRMIAELEWRLNVAAESEEGGN